MNKVKFLVDYFLNLLASFLPLFALQFIIQPFISRSLNTDIFGLMITLSGILNMAKGIFGNTLNNIRQLEDKKYSEKNVQGDFNILLLINLFCSFIFMAFFVLLYSPNFNLYSLLILSITAILWVASEYLRVSYFLFLNFKKILISSLALTIGYAIGLVLYNSTARWEFVFLFGGLFQLVYILFTSELVKERFQITILFNRTLKQFIILFCASCISMSISYFDRLFIYPLMSANEATLYYVATLIGKTASLALSPAASVLLAYLIKMESIDIRIFKKIILGVVLISIPAYAVFYYGNFILLPVLYPSLLKEVMPYLQITAFIAVFETIKLIFNPILLRFCKMKVVLQLNVVNITMYLILGIFFVKEMQLTGYCYAMLITNVVIALLYMVIPYIKIVAGKKAALNER